MTDKEEQSDELLVLSEILDAPNFSHEGTYIDLNSLYYLDKIFS